MLAKTKKNTRAKSNVAKATGGSSLLGKKVKFNWKIAAVIGVILIAAVGYLFVRYSNAAGYIWPGQNITIHAGKRTQKTDGRIAVQSVPDVIAQRLMESVNSSVTNNDTYCFSGKATKEILYYTISYEYVDSTGYSVGNLVSSGGPNAGSGATGPRVTAGDFLICGKVPGRPTGAYPKTTYKIRCA
jgi:hypothetical protein